MCSSRVHTGAASLHSKVLPQPHCPVDTRTCEHERGELAAAAVPACCQLLWVDQTVQWAGAVVGLCRDPLQVMERGWVQHSMPASIPVNPLPLLDSGSLTWASEGKSRTSAATVTVGNNGVSYCSAAADGSIQPGGLRGPGCRRGSGSGSTCVGPAHHHRTCTTAQPQLAICWTMRWYQEALFCTRRCASKCRTGGQPAR